MGLFDSSIEKPHALRTLVVLLVAALVCVVDGFLWHRYREEVSLARSTEAARDRPTGELVSAPGDARRPMAIFLGDSFTEGAGGTRYGGYVSTAGKIAGLDGRPSWVGGTGIVDD